MDPCQVTGVKDFQELHAEPENPCRTTGQKFQGVSGSPAPMQNAATRGSILEVTAGQSAPFATQP